MEKIFEFIMLLLFNAASVLLISRFAKSKEPHSPHERATAVAMGIGFIIGAIGKMSVGPSEATFPLYVTGAFLCYTAVLLSFPQIGDEQKKERDE